MEPKEYRYEEFCESDGRKEKELTATKYASTTYRTCIHRNRLLCTFGYHMETVVAFKQCEHFSQAQITMNVYWKNLELTDTSKGNAIMDLN